MPPFVPPKNIASTFKGLVMTEKSALNFTKQTIQSLAMPEKGISTYRDTKEQGLSLYVTSKGAKTFFVRKRINGRDERMIIGAFPDISIEQARKKAQELKGLVASGKDPAEEKRRSKQDNLTFGALFEEYLERYSKKHKKSWKYDEREVTKFLSHWLKRKLSSIKKTEVQLLHEKIHDENGLYQANRILERIRAIYNKGIEWGWEGQNPATGIKKYKEKSRDRFIQPDELPRFFASVNAEENQTLKDYVWLSLLTGARKSNVLAMRWDQISWERREWRIPDTKNGEVVTLPLVEQAMTILDARRRLTNTEWVFPSETAKQGHFADPKRGWNRLLQRAKIEDLHIHDIRRTLGSYQAITGASMQIIGKSLGHKSQQATQIYARLNLDPVRASMEKATAAMFGDLNEK